MDYAQASYFDGFHFQHIAAWKNHLRLKRIDALNRRLIARSPMDRRTGSRIFQTI